MDSHLFDEGSESEANQQKNERSAEHRQVGVIKVMPESRSGQNTADSGGQIDTFLKRFAGVAIDVGQHTGETAQTGGDQTNLRGNTEMIGDPSEGNAGGGTASDVLLKITQFAPPMGKVPTMKNTGKDTEFPPQIKGQFCRSHAGFIIGLGTEQRKC
jgi:hypothetical protein